MSMENQTMNQRLGKYEVYEVNKELVTTIYRIKNKGEIPYKRDYVNNKLIIDSTKSDDIQIGPFKSMHSGNDVRYDSAMFHIGDSTVQLLMDDEVTHIIIYNKDLKKREVTKCKLNMMLS